MVFLLLKGTRSKHADIFSRSLSCFSTSRADEDAFRLQMLSSERLGISISVFISTIWLRNRSINHSFSHGILISWNNELYLLDIFHSLSHVMPFFFNVRKRSIILEFQGIASTNSIHHTTLLLSLLNRWWVVICEGNSWALHGCSVLLKKHRLLFQGNT